MHHVTHDGAALAAAAVGPGMSCCTVCGDPLSGAEPFWLTDYPRGEHTRCRRWRGAPFPFARQLLVLRRMWRAAPTPAARDEVASAGQWLAREEAWWPESASAGRVMEILARLRRVRMVLAERGVDRKLVGRL